MKKKMKLYEGQIVHTKETIRCLYKVTYNKYELKKVIVRMLVGAFLTIVGLIGIDSYILQAGLLLIGCWLLVSKDFPAVCKADRAVEARKHMLPIISTVFYDDIVELSSKSCMEMEYGQFKFLFEESQYLFLFLSKESVCMIDKDTLRPNDIEKFKIFVTNRTGIEWEHSKSFFMMSFMDLFQLIKAS